MTKKPLPVPDLMPHLQMVDVRLNSVRKVQIDDFCRETYRDRLYREDVEIPQQKENVYNDRLRADLIEAKLGTYKAGGF